MAAHDDSGQLLRSTRPAAMAEERTVAALDINVELTG